MLSRTVHLGSSRRHCGSLGWRPIASSSQRIEHGSVALIHCDTAAVKLTACSGCATAGPENGPHVLTKAICQ